MENYNNGISDITYQSELIPFFSKNNRTKKTGLIRTMTYSHFRVRKLCAH